MRRLIIGFYSAFTPQDWQFGPGIYLGSHLELSLYLGPWSLNLEFQLEKPSFTVHGHNGLDPFTKKPYYKVYRPKAGDKW